MLKVGIIGTGIIAREHAAALAMLPEYIMLAAADMRPERLDDFADAWKIERRYRWAADLIADHEVALIAIATPPSAHEELTIAALKAGKYVLCEKPLAHTLASAERIATFAANFPGRLSVSYQYRYDPQIRRMLWLTANGWIGEVQEAIVERHGYIPHSIVGKGGWWGNWDVAGGGVLMTQAIHELDIMLQVMGAPRSVTADMETRYTAIESEDWIEALVRFNDGCTARCAASVNSGEMRGRLTIKGSLGSVSPNQLEFNDPARREAAIKAVDGALPETRPLSMSLSSRALRKLPHMIGRERQPELNNHAFLYREIACRIASGKPLPVPPKEALMSLHLCAGIYEAAIIGTEVELPISPDAVTFGGVSQNIYRNRKRAPASPVRAVTLPKSNVVRIGLIGLDTSHAPTFADLLHNPYNSDHIPGAKIVGAFPGGSPDMAISATRVGPFTAELKNKYQVPILDTPQAVADAADLVFILSSDGRTHPGLFRSVAGRGKPVFIDKPFAISRADAELIFAIAHRTETKMFATSAFRYADGLVSALNEIRTSGERIVTCSIRYWGQIQPTQGRFFWYGIHGAEMLLAVMGRGIGAVEAKTVGVEDIIEVEHKDGRRSLLIGHHNDGTFRAVIDTDKRQLNIDLNGATSARLLAAALDVLTPGGYPRLWRTSDAGSVSGRPGKPLDPDEAETMEVIALLEAAQQSYLLGCKTGL
jgi:predicted dehydrogenase